MKRSISNNKKGKEEKESANNAAVEPVAKRRSTTKNRVLAQEAAKISEVKESIPVTKNKDNKKPSADPFPKQKAFVGLEVTRKSNRNKVDATATGAKTKKKEKEEEKIALDEDDIETAMLKLVRERAKSRNTKKTTTEEEEDEDDDDDSSDSSEEGYDEEGEEEEEYSEDDSDQEAEIDDKRIQQIQIDEDTKKSIIEQVGKLQWKHSQIKRGVVYVGRIPKGFYEPQMKPFFGQFGKVTRLRISRNPRTGRMRHYGFVEFEFEEVAKIVAKAMNNYILFEHVLKCEFVPPEQVHPKLFNNRGRVFKRINWRSVELTKRNKSIKKMDSEKVKARDIRRINKKNEQLKAKGIDYQFPVAAKS